MLVQLERATPALLGKLLQLLQHRSVSSVKLGRMQARDRPAASLVFQERMITIKARVQSVLDVQRDGMVSIAVWCPVVVNVRLGPIPQEAHPKMSAFRAVRVSTIMIKTRQPHAFSALQAVSVSQHKLAVPHALMHAQDLGCAPLDNRSSSRTVRRSGWHVQVQKGAPRL
jgi:hypothetical protein